METVPGGAGPSPGLPGNLLWVTCRNPGHSPQTQSILKLINNCWHKMSQCVKSWIKGKGTGGPEDSRRHRECCLTQAGGAWRPHRTQTGGRCCRYTREASCTGLAGRGYLQAPGKGTGDRLGWDGRMACVQVVSWQRGWGSYILPEYTNGDTCFKGSVD